MAMRKWGGGRPQPIRQQRPSSRGSAAPANALHSPWEAIQTKALTVLVWVASLTLAMTIGRPPVPDDLLAHVAPLGWEHIALTGDYVWTEANPAAPFRPLREVRSMFQPLAA